MFVPRTVVNERWNLFKWNVILTNKVWFFNSCYCEHVPGKFSLEGFVFRFCFCNLNFYTNISIVHERSLEITLFFQYLLPFYFISFYFLAIVSAHDYIFEVCI